MSEKKIPTALSLTLLIIATVSAVFLISRPAIFSPQADVSCEPINEKITNLTDKSFTVSWSTQKNCSGLLSLVQPTTRIIQDLRTEGQGSSDRNTHYYLVDNLSPETNYRFEIISQGQTYQNPSYSAQTAAIPQSPIPVANLAWGKVLDENQNPLAGLIVYLDIPGASQLSSLTSSQGVWIVSLANSFDALHADRFYPPPDTVEHITIDAGLLGQISLIGNTDFNNPVPDIIFSTANPPVLPLGGGANEPSGAGILPPQEKINQNPKASFQLQNPKEGETINSLSPEFFGTAPQGTVLEITLESLQTFSAQVEPDSLGEWSWSPPENLAPGEHTLTIKVINPLTGLSETLTRNFYVYAADENDPAFESSPSAVVDTPTPTPIPSSTPILLPTTINTSTPTLVPTSTPTPVVRSAKPATDSGLPSPGTTFPTFFILSLGLLLFFAGAILVIK
jgi:hypothetical protein